MKSLMSEFRELNTQRNQRLLRSLELSLVPSKARPGSIEALIDDLVNYNNETGWNAEWWEGDHFKRIAVLGFDAVPLLIEHLEDDRLTRGVLMGFYDHRPWNLRVRHVVSDLLSKLAGEELEISLADRSKGMMLDKAEALRWWNEARKVGEEAYLLAHVLPARKVGAALNQHQLKVIQKKYPKDIPALYRTVLDRRPDLESGWLVAAIRKCNLSSREQLELLSRGAEHTQMKHRLPALDLIMDLDTKRFDTLLLATIEAFPQDVQGEYWNCPEGNISLLAIDSDDPRVWRALEKVAKRSAVGLRLQMLDRFGTWGAKHRPERVRYLMSFLNDSTLRDRSSNEKYLHDAAAPYPKIEVRDFAALELANLLKIKVELKPDRTPDWAKLRDAVRHAAERELQKGK
jgi:hypothetical protein